MTDPNDSELQDQRLLSRLQAMGRSMAAESSDPEEAIRYLHERMAPAVHPLSNVAPRRYAVAFGALAACVALVVAFGLQRSWHTSGTAAVAHAYATAPGERLQVRLRDGTQITLGPASRLTVPRGYAMGARNLVLEGEAYFGVVHDVRQPLTVQAHGVITRDVGTAFDVRSYPEDSVVRVAVVEGEVMVTNALDAMPASLVRGDIGYVSNRGVAIDRSRDPSAIGVWMQGGLAFHDTPLPQAIREVARAYNLDITLVDSTLADQKVTATFQHESADEILSEITDVVGARYERSGRKVTVRRRTSIAQPAVRNTEPPPLRTAQIHVAE